MVSVGGGDANGYDLVIHDECAAGIDDPELVGNVLQPHFEGVIWTS